MKKALRIVFLIAFSLSIGKCVYFLEDGFNLRRIRPMQKSMSLGITPKTQKILNQPFIYLARGRQCFAFASLDGKYVLKLPRTDIYSIPFWLKALPLKKRRLRVKKVLQEREAFITQSFHFSFHQLKKQTGVLAIHTGISSAPSDRLHIIDATGRSHFLPLNKTPFILQAKHPLAIETFKEAMENNDIPKAQSVLNALASVIKERANTGILNRDRSFLRNYSFDGEKAYQIDIGSFYQMPSLSQNELKDKSYKDSMDAIEEWLNTYYPDMRLSQ